MEARVPDHLDELIKTIEYKPKWTFSLVETHEAAEFFRVDGVREFAPHHSNGEDPYRVWHVSDWATAAKSSGDA